MRTTCHCGMTIERAAPGQPCAECGTPCCPSCAITFDATRYCRWCATPAALARPAA